MIFLNFEFHRYLLPFSKEESSLQRMKKLFQERCHKTTISILLSFVHGNCFQLPEKLHAIQLITIMIFQKKYLCIKKNLEKYSKISPHSFSIHQYFETSSDLKHLWMSLSSKEKHFFFDTPNKDAKK